MDGPQLLLMLGAPAGFLAGALFRGKSIRYAITGAVAIVVIGSLLSLAMRNLVDLAYDESGQDATLWGTLWILVAVAVASAAFVVTRWIRRPRLPRSNKSPFDFS